MTQHEIIEMARQVGLCRTQSNFDDWIDAGPSTLELVEFAKLVAAREREVIAEQFWGCVMSDLEHGVKSLNEKASFDFQKNMPDLSKFGRWLNERDEA